MSDLKKRTLKKRGIMLFAYLYFFLCFTLSYIFYSVSNFFRSLALGVEDHIGRIAEKLKNKIHK